MPQSRASTHAETCLLQCFAMLFFIVADLLGVLFSTSFFKIEIGRFRIPSCTNRRTWGSKNEAVAESCVTVCAPVLMSRATRNVPCDQPRTRNGCPSRPQRNK